MRCCPGPRPCDLPLGSLLPPPSSSLPPGSSTAMTATTIDRRSRRFIDLTEPGRSRMSHLPGLDGLRGLAVVGVLAFHAGFERMVGGYLGVSTFFTLSGFLITSLLLAEARDTGFVRLGSFWGRRFRRLLPAALATLFLVAVVFAPLVATADQRADLRGGLLSSLFDVANWYFVLSGDSYGQLFASPSPVLHFWSLAIEEQFYLLFPLILLGLWRATRGDRVRLGAALAGLAALSAVEPVIFGLDADRVYFGTDTRAAELLLGGVLAVVLSSTEVRRRLVGTPALRVGALGAGAVALVVQLWWWWSLDQSAPWLYRGGFAAYAVLSCLVLVAAAMPSGPVSAALSVRPMRWLGERSYGIYLAHWPIFLAIRQTWPDLGRWPGTIIGVAASLLMAEVSYRFLERPIRAGTWPRVGRALPVGAVAMLVVALVSLPQQHVDEDELIPDFAADLEALQDLPSGADLGPTTVVPVPEPAEPTEVTDGSEPGAEPEVPTTLPPPPAPRVAIFGDSTALGVGIPFDVWARESGRAVAVRGDATLGCGVSRFDARRVDTVVPARRECVAWPERWGGSVAENQPDVALLLTSVWEVPDARLPGQRDWRSVGDPEVDDFVRGELLAAVDVLASQGAMVVLVQWPEFGTWADDGRPDAVSRQMRPERMRRFNELLAEVAEQRPDTVRVIDLAGTLGDRSQDRRLRPDGTHFTTGSFADDVNFWFGPRVEELWQEWWRTHRQPAT
jgi:peptidoglycan/LPS O-acetylase OafA/YrhL